MLDIRPATLDDYREFFGVEPARTVKVLAGFRDGKLMGMGGYVIEGNKAIVFSDFKGEVTKREVIQAGRAIMKLARSAGIALLAEVKGNDTAMRHWGFRPLKGSWYMAGGI